MSFVEEFIKFLFNRKKYWLLTIIIVVVGVLIVLTQALQCYLFHTFLNF